MLDGNCFVNRLPRIDLLEGSCSETTIFLASSRAQKGIRKMLTEQKQTKCLFIYILLVHKLHGELSSSTMIQLKAATIGWSWTEIEVDTDTALKQHSGE